MKEIYINSFSHIKNKLFLYKSFLYRNIIFITDSSDEDLNLIITALNIKKKKQRIKYIFDKCCDKIDNFNDGKNICGFKNNQCINQQKDNCKFINGCCRLCIHQSPNGCKSSNLSCKMFYCTSVTDKYKVLKYKDLKLLKLLSLRQKLIVRNNFFASREEFLTDLNINSLIIYALRLFYRTIRTPFILKKIKIEN